jgi:two-component system phosphate regulon sensor histidine kinase PhoR
LIRRVWGRLVALAIVSGALVGFVDKLVVEAGAFGSASPLTIGILAFGVVLLAGVVTVAWLAPATRGMADATRAIVRDTRKRIPGEIGGPGDELRELGDWINALAEDADDSHRALAHQRALLAAVADGMTHGVIAIDDDHRIELINDAAREMLGVTASPIGEPLIEFVRLPEIRDLIDGELGSVIDVKLPLGPRALIRIARKYGAGGCVLLLEDITAMRRLETVRRDFVANVSHELRTPVAVIRANAETLLAGAKDDPAMAAKLVDGLHRNAERLSRILADLLDLSRLEAGQYRLELASVPIRAGVDQALSAVEAPAAARQVTVDVRVPDGLRVRADAKALDQILVNLIDNAVKYTRAEGHVWVEAREEGDRVRIEIRDDGPGIAEKHRARVFERFYRADPSRSREAGGTGLGLSIVKHLVESMGGQVGVDPNTPIGTVFWLRLPQGARMEGG